MKLGSNISNHFEVKLIKYRMYRAPDKLCICVNSYTCSITQINKISRVQQLSCFNKLPNRFISIVIVRHTGWADFSHS
jgi:hypothetical protein